jgi:hypothetical protein
MQTIGTHGLACIGEEDFAALALYMQCLGQDIDTTLGAQQGALQGFLDRPTIIVTNPLAKVITTGTPTIANLFTTVHFNNSTFMNLVLNSSPNTNTITIGSPAGAAVTVPYPRGVYICGGTTRMTAVGAVTAFSQRGMNITVDDPTAPPPGFNSPSVTDRTYDPGVGGGNIGQNVKFEVVLDGISGVNVTLTSFHTNVASDVTVQALPFAYVTYIGPRDIVEVT